MIFFKKDNTLTVAGKRHYPGVYKAFLTRVLTVYMNQNQTKKILETLGVPHIPQSLLQHRVNCPPAGFVDTGYVFEESQSPWGNNFLQKFEKNRFDEIKKMVDYLCKDLAEKGLELELVSCEKSEGISYSGIRVLFSFKFGKGWEEQEAAIVERNHKEPSSVRSDLIGSSYYLVSNLDKYNILIAKDGEPISDESFASPKQLALLRERGAPFSFCLLDGTTYGYSLIPKPAPFNEDAFRELGRAITESKVHFRVKEVADEIKKELSTEELVFLDKIRYNNLTQIQAEAASHLEDLALKYYKAKKFKEYLDAGDFSHIQEEVLTHMDTFSQMVVTKTTNMIVFAKRMLNIYN